MTGREVKEKLLSNGYILADIALKLNMSPQALNSKLSVKNAKIDLLEDLSHAIGVELSFFNGASKQTNVNGDNINGGSVTVNKTENEKLLELLKKKDEQIDRLLSIIEKLS